MKNWNELLTAAMSGTGNSPAPSDIGNEDALLKSAGELALQRRMDFTPATLPASSIAPCVDEKRKACSPLSAQHLETMLTGRFERALEEWLDCAELKLKRVPELLLPDVLKKGASVPSLRRFITPVVGERGLWLAAQNPDWRYALAAASLTPGEARDFWLTGTAETRLELLRRTRESHPSLALELTQLTWATESAETRADFVESFAMGLGMGDEAFLESNLDSRSLMVKRAAARLLSTMPQSRYAQRAKDRATATLRFVSGGYNDGRAGAALDVNIPDLTKQLTKDCIDPKVAHAIPSLQTDEKGMILALLIESVPPSFWAATFQQSPQKLIEAAQNEKTPYRLEILTGWQLAAARFENAEWAAELLTRGTAMSDEARLNLVSVLEPAKQEEILAAAVNAITTSDDWDGLREAMTGLRRHGRRCWGESLGRVIIAKLAQVPECGNELREYLAYTLPSDLAGECENLWPKTENPAANDTATVVESTEANAGDEFRAAMNFRREMLAALRAE